MTLQCGHSAATDVDIICPQCGRSFIAYPYIPYLLILGYILLTYYWRKFQFSDLLLPLFIIMLITYFSCILRNRNEELSKTLMLCMPPVFIWIILHGQLPIYIKGIEEIILVLSFIVVVIPIMSSIALGFNDAVNMNGINKGSYWVVISIFISLTITILHFIFPSILALNLPSWISSILSKINNFVEIIYKYRIAFVAIVLCLISIISISVSLIRELRNRRRDHTKPEYNQEYNYPINAFFNSIADAIKTASDFVVQILGIIVEEVFSLFKDTFFRTILILIRLIRPFVLIFLSVILAVSVLKIVGFMGILWNSNGFWSAPFLEWIIFLVFTLLSCVVLWLTMIVAYKKWRDNSKKTITLQDAFVACLGNKTNNEEAYYESITISTYMYIFFYCLTFLGAWLIINLIHHLFGIDYPRPLGIIFCLSIGVVLIMGISRMVSKPQNR